MNKARKVLDRVAGLAAAGSHVVTLAILLPAEVLLEVKAKDVKVKGSRANRVHTILSTYNTLTAHAVKLYARHGIFGVMERAGIMEDTHHCVELWMSALSDGLSGTRIGQIANESLKLHQSLGPLVLKMDAMQTEAAG